MNIRTLTCTKCGQRRWDFTLTCSCEPPGPARQKRVQRPHNPNPNEDDQNDQPARSKAS